VYFLEVM